MKKILFVANLDKEHIKKFHIPTINKFIENGWQVDVACAGNENIPNIANRYHMKWGRNPISLRIFGEIRKLKKIIHDNNYDLIYCHTPTGGVAGRLASRKMRKNGLKVVYFAHGFHFYRGAPLLNWLLFYPAEKIMSRYTDLLITLNREDYDFAKRHFCRKTSYFLSNGVGVDLLKFSNSNFIFERENYRKEFHIDQQTICLGYVAEIIKNKNQILLLKVVKLLLSKGINAKLLLVGPDHTNGKFDKLISKWHLSSYVICTGWRNDANSIISAFDFCVPSSLREGLGLNVIEAMEKGIVVVANDNRGHRTIISNLENGIIVKKNDFKSMADSIVGLLNDLQLREKLIKNAFETAKKFDEKKVVNQLFEKIVELMK